MFKFSKKMFPWRSTAYVVGLPRSGKSTILNILLSCNNVEGVDEPLELQILAQKGATHDATSVEWEEYLDSYWVCLENYFSELVLGRRYNFRRVDKSCIFNVKSKEKIRSSMNRRRRSDVVRYAAETDSVLSIAFNNMEASIRFICSEVPDPRLIYVSRPLRSVAAEIAAKGWLSDDQLAAQANLGIAFTRTVRRADRDLFIPYQIPDDLVDVFVRQSDFDRAVLYAHLQGAELQRRVTTANVPVLKIDFDQMLENPREEAARVFEFVGVQPTATTERLLSSIGHLEDAVAEIDLHNRQLDAGAGSAI